MAVSGLYGVLAYLISQRRREFDIRMAMGATSADIVRMVLRRSFRLAAAGAALGAMAALGVARLIAHAVGTIDLFDWASYAGTAPLIIAAAMGAAYFPARRALRTDPATTLRSD